MTRLRRGVVVVLNTMVYVCVASFVSVWSTTAGASFTLPLLSNGVYDFNVSWGDSQTNHITEYNQAEVTHVYATSGEVTISITGIIQGFTFRDRTDVLLISSWGPLQLIGGVGYYFSWCTNLVINASDDLDVSQVTNMEFMFYNANQIIGTNFARYLLYILRKMQYVFIDHNDERMLMTTM